MTPLTKKQILHFAKRLTREGTPVRFQEGGQTVNIVTGEKQPKGINVIHQLTYWNFDRETAREIAKATGTKAVFSK